MFEKFFAKKEKNPTEKKAEQVLELGGRAVELELGREMEPKRSGGFMLCTVMAMALAAGMSGTAEAQVKGVGPAGRGFGGQVFSEVFREGISGIGGRIDKSTNARQERLEAEFSAKMRQLQLAVRELDSQYNREKKKLLKSGGDLVILENNYMSQRSILLREMADLEKEYKKKQRNNSIKRTIVGTIIQGARGW